MSLRCVLGESTLFSGAKKLMPSHWLLLKHGTERTERYWDVAEVRQARLIFPEALERFDSLLMETVNARRMSDVPLGAVLSGDVDSSAIVACMTCPIEESVKTFAVDYFDHPASRELGCAAIVADHSKTEYHEFILSAKVFSFHGSPS